MNGFNLRMFRLKPKGLRAVARDQGNFADLRHYFITLDSTHSNLKVPYKRITFFVPFSAIFWQSRD